MEEIKSEKIVDGEQSLSSDINTTNIVSNTCDNCNARNVNRYKTVIFVLLWVVCICSASALYFSIVPYFTLENLIAPIGVVLPLAICLLALSVIVPVCYYRNGKKLSKFGIILSLIYIAIAIFFSIYLLMSEYAYYYRLEEFYYTSVLEHQFASFILDGCIFIAIVILKLNTIANRSVFAIENAMNNKYLAELKQKNKKLNISTIIIMIVLCVLFVLFLLFMLLHDSGNWAEWPCAGSQLLVFVALFTIYFVNRKKCYTPDIILSVITMGLSIFWIFYSRKEIHFGGDYKSELNILHIIIAVIFALLIIISIITKKPKIEKVKNGDRLSKDEQAKYKSSITIIEKIKDSFKTVDKVKAFTTTNTVLMWSFCGMLIFSYVLFVAGFISYLVVNLKILLMLIFITLLYIPTIILFCINKRKLSYANKVLLVIFAITALVLSIITLVSNLSTVGFSTANSGKMVYTIWQYWLIFAFTIIMFVGTIICIVFDGKVRKIELANDNTGYATGNVINVVANSSTNNATNSVGTQSQNVANATNNVPTESIEKELTEVKRLLDSGIITDEEYAKMRSSVIKKYYDI